MCALSSVDPLSGREVSGVAGLGLAARGEEVRTRPPVSAFGVLGPAFQAV